MKLHPYLSENLLCLVNSEEKSRGLEMNSFLFFFCSERKGSDIITKEMTKLGGE